MKMKMNNKNKFKKAFKELNNLRDSQMERQPLSVSIKELRDLADELDRERKRTELQLKLKYPITKKWQVNIKRKSKFDNWKLEK